MKRLALLLWILSFVNVDYGNNMTENSVFVIDAEGTLRDKRDTNFQLDDSEIARQNQITQQIFANYVERRLFPNRSTSQRIPTIAEILPKPTTTRPRLRPRPRGFAASSNDSHKNFKRGFKKRQRNSNKSQQSRAANNQNVVIDDEAEESEQLVNISSKDNTYTTDDEIDFDGQESLQSVESEQHDRYYSDIFNRDPSENEVDSGKFENAPMPFDVKTI